MGAIVRTVNEGALDLLSVDDIEKIVKVLVLTDDEARIMETDVALQVPLVFEDQVGIRGVRSGI